VSGDVCGEQQHVTLRRRGRAEKMNDVRRCFELARGDRSSVARRVRVSYTQTEEGPLAKQRPAGKRGFVLLVFGGVYRGRLTGNRLINLLPPTRHQSPEPADLTYLKQAIK